MSNIFVQMFQSVIDGNCVVCMELKIFASYFLGLHTISLLLHCGFMSISSPVIFVFRLSKVATLPIVLVLGEWGGDSPTTIKSRDDETLKM